MSDIKTLVRCATAVALLIAMRAMAQTPCVVETIAGAFKGPIPGDGGPGSAAELVSPIDMRVGPDDAVYISDSRQRVIRRVGTDGVIETIAGTGEKGFSGDGGPATAALLSEPGSMAFGPDGSLFFRDSTRIRKVKPDGVISTVAGNGEFDFPTLGVRALETTVSGVSRITVDSQGNLYLLLASRRQVLRVDSDGILTLFAGIGRVGARPAISGDGGPAVDASLGTPVDLAVDSTGAVYILETSRDRIRKIELDGTINAYLGEGQGTHSPEGTSREQITLTDVNEIEIDGSDRLYWMDLERVQVRRLPPDGTLEDVALLLPTQRLVRLSVSANARVFVALRAEVFEVADDGTQTVVAGTGRTGARGDGGPARDALVGSIDDLAVGPNGEIYFADRLFFRVRVIDVDGSIARFAGTGDTTNSSADGMAALDSAIQPSGVAVDSDSRVVISDVLLGVLVRVEPDGTLKRVAGDGRRVTRCRNSPTCGDGGPALEASIPQIGKVVADSLGNLYVFQNRGFTVFREIRRIDTDGIIRSLPVSDSDGVSAMATTVDSRLLAVSGRFDTATLTSYGADGEQDIVVGYSGFFGESRAIAKHPNGSVYVADNRGRQVSRLDPEGRRHLVAGAEFAEFGGGDGSIDDLILRGVTTLKVTPSGDLLIGDSGSQRILRIVDVASCADDPRPQIALAGTLNGASFDFELAPGTIFSVFGVDLGPDELQTAQLEENTFPTQIGGTRILVNGVPAPLIFAAAGQVSGVIPWGTAIDQFSTEAGFIKQVVGPPEIVVEKNGIRSVPSLDRIEPAAPAFFTVDSSGSGLAAALNQDGSINGGSNPAAVGSVVVLFGTGFGRLDPEGIDGQLSGPPFGQLTQSLTITIAGQEVDILYAGAAPGLVSGVMQLNIRIPNDLPVGGRC